MRGILIPILVLLMTVGCEEEKTTNLGGLGGPCDLDLGAMVDTTWVMDRINPGHTTEPDHKTRMRYWQEGDALKAQYNVSSVGDMFTYTCTRRQRDRDGDGEIDKDDLYCLHDLDKDFVYRTCASMEVQGVGCTPEKIRERAPTVSAEHLEAGVKEAMEDVTTKFKDKESPAYKQYAFAHNNLGNKLQFVFYTEITANTCQLMITDMNFTLYEGKWREDSNPVGRNAFVKSEESLWWEDCTDNLNYLFGRKETDFPATPEKTTQCKAGACTFGVGEAANFLYTGPDAAEPEEGCTYSMDIGVDGKPAKSGVSAEVTKVAGKDRVHWVASHSFTGPGLHAVAMARSKTCAGKTEKVDVACTLAKVQ